MRFKTTTIATLCVSGLAVGAAMADTKAVLLHPHGGDHPFFKVVDAVSTSVADNLEMELQIIATDHDHLQMVRDLERVLSEDKPDVVVLKPFRGNGTAMLELCDQYQTPCMTFMSGLSEKAAAKAGAPRENYTHWIGSLIPDDVHAGYSLAEQAVKRAREKGFVNADGTVEIIGISGVVSDQASVDRVRGLEEYVAQDPNAEILQVFPSDWKRDRAQFIFDKARQRYGSSVYWVAFDDGALGVIDRAQAAGLNPAEDLVLTGADWLPDAQQALQAGTMTVSSGGHFTVGAWALVMAYDYVHGADFKDAYGSTEIDFEMSLLTEENVGVFMGQFAGDYTDVATWEGVAWESQSRAKQANVSTYDTSVNALIN